MFRRCNNRFNSSVDRLDSRLEKLENCKDTSDKVEMEPATKLKLVLRYTPDAKEAMVLSPRNILLRVSKVTDTHFQVDRAEMCSLISRI